MRSRGRGSIQILDMYCDLEKDILSNLCGTGFQSGRRNTRKRLYVAVNPG